VYEQTSQEESVSYEQEEQEEATPINFARGDRLARVRPAFPGEPAPRLAPRSRVDPQQVGPGSL